MTGEGVEEVREIIEEIAADSEIYEPATDDVEVNFEDSENVAEIDDDNGFGGFLVPNGRK